MCNDTYIAETEGIDNIVEVCSEGVEVIAKIWLARAMTTHIVGCHPIARPGEVFNLLVSLCSRLPPSR
jgi:hypothetical protein